MGANIGPEQPWKPAVFPKSSKLCVLLPLSCAAAPRSPSLRRCCFVFNEQMGSLVASGEGETGPESRPAPVNASACVVPDAWSFARSN